MNKNWYMLNIRKNSEKKICALLKKKNIETFSPLYQRQMRQLNRVKIFSEPLFASCIFARLEEDDFKIITKLNSTINIAFWKNKYAVIPDNEIKTIKEFVQLYQNIKLEKSTVQPGEILFTNSPDYLVNLNSISITIGTIKVKLPSIGFTMIVEAQRDKEFDYTNTLFSKSIQPIYQT
ncbi:MAG: transcription termination/antitermination NusG family protein [Ferruginibacter sp.]